jgi:cytochrome c oxidase cbb3-type subunit III
VSMSDFWSFYIIAITVVNIIGCVALLYFTRKKKQLANEGETTGHVYDGIEEYDYPLPRWWLWLFYITIVFAIVYLVLYPGLGHFRGVLNWTQASQYEEEVRLADKKYLPLYQKYSSMPIEKLIAEPKALKMGQAIFANTCFGCHGADARGSIGYPDLTDNEWIYGGSAEAIKRSIMEGRTGIMPAWSTALSNDDILKVSSYISSKNTQERAYVKEFVTEGESIYQTNCAACHQADLSGNQLIGAPNLADSVWLHGASSGFVQDVISQGRINRMPAHDAILGEHKAHLVAAYVYSLSNKLESNSESN